MRITDLESLLARFEALGAGRVLCKRLAENDNSKQQVYLGGSFDSLSVLPFGDVASDSSVIKPVFKAVLSLSWLNDQGHLAPAPGTRLILYPSYPEVRMSGFLRGCPTAPARLMQPIPRANRRFNNGPDGRLLFLAILADRRVVAFLAPAGTVIARDFEAWVAQARPDTTGVFLEVPLPGIGDTRALLLRHLRDIHRAGWHPSCRLHADGTRHTYAARNGAGYTLEALMGIRPNSRAEPDFHGWELKACGSDRVTLMTPEPDAGFYGSTGVAAFVRRYGRAVDGDTRYFTGSHRIGSLCPATGQTLTLRGFDPGSAKIIDVDGGIELVAANGEVSAGWSFSRLLEHWGRKHASAAYAPYRIREGHPPEYLYTSPVHLGEGTNFVRFLHALASGFVIYDPGSKIMGASTARPRTKARSQFRIRRRQLAHLYDRFTAEPID